MAQRNIVGHRDAEELRIKGLSGRCRDLEHASVVDGTVLRIEVRVRPDCSQLGIADVVEEARVGFVNGVAYRCLASSI